jgi:hypothetical protein
MFMRKNNNQTLANIVTKNVLQYMTTSGMLFTQRDITNIHAIITRTVNNKSSKQIKPVPVKNKKKKPTP